MGNQNFTIIIHIVILFTLDFYAQTFIPFFVMYLFWCFSRQSFLSLEEGITLSIKIWLIMQWCATFVEFSCMFFNVLKKIASPKSGRLDCIVA